MMVWESAKMPPLLIICSSMAEIDSVATPLLASVITIEVKPTLEESHKILVAAATSMKAVTATGSAKAASTT